MANTVGTPGYIGQVQKMDTSTPAYGPAFDAIHQQLLNNDALLNSEILGMLQKAANSGVINYASITAGLTSNLNAFKFGKDTALINGIIDVLTNLGGMSDGTNLVQLDLAPTANISPALPSSARDDLVFLEAWINATSGAPQFRIRAVDGVDFSTYPEGLSAPNVYAQGGNNLATTKTFSKASSISGQSFSSDNGLYVSGSGSAGDQTTLATLDGYVYAIPLFRVRRRNNAGFDPDNNPLGAKDYFSTSPIIQSVQLGPNQTITFSNSQDMTKFYAGQILVRCNTTTFAVQVVSVNAAAYQITANVFCSNANAMYLDNYQYLIPASDRPDGLYSNIVDVSDIIDLRHQVSITGFDNQVLLERNLDLLLRGLLTTNDPVRYRRDYIGLNTAAGLVDDANTLLRCDFNAQSVNGTANGSAVNGTISSGSPSFVNGVQGLALGASSSQYISYPVSIASGANTYSIELMFKATFNWNDGVNHGFLTFVDGSGNNLASLYKWSNNWLQLTVDSTHYANAPLPSNLNIDADGSWHKILVTVNNGVVSMILDGVALNVGYYGGATSLPAFSVNVVNIWLGYSKFSNGYTNAAIDVARISSVVRTETLLPSNFFGPNGDRVLDGPMGDFSQWSDDLGSIIGVYGRSNPYGLTRVPSQIAERISLNGSEIRHYCGNGVTHGLSTYTLLGSNPTGAFDVSGESVLVNANEAADGARTTFTFNRQSIIPIPALYVFDSGQRNYPKMVINGSLYPPISSATYNMSTGLLTVTFPTPPAIGASVQTYYIVGQRHAHFIPSTKGFIIHDWIDDNVSTNGSTTVFQTSKYNITNLSEILATPSGNTAAMIQNGGYSVAGLNAQTALSASAAQNATSITLASGSNFVNGQNIRISKGDGTWYTTTISGISGNTITVPALGVALSQNAVVQGAAIVTFTTAPVTGTIDLIYESVYTPGLGDYIRVMYQHTPYQGVGNTSDVYSVVANRTNALFVTYGTGKVSPGNISYYKYTAPITPQLPLGSSQVDNQFKSDAVSLSNNNFGSNGETAINLAVPYTEAVYTSANALVALLRAGNITSLWNSLVIRGFSGLINNSNPSGITALSAYFADVSSGIPRLGVLPFIVANQNGELLLLVFTQYSNSTVTNTIGAPAGSSGVDVFKLQGRPMIKNYGGVSA